MHWQLLCCSPIHVDACFSREKVTLDVTVKDIGAKLGLSQSTISRALADSKKISQATKERVRAAAIELGYIPNSAARFVRHGKSTVVGLILPNVANEFYSTIAQNLTQLASERGRQLILSLSADDPDREAAIVRTLAEARPSGIIAALTVNPREETISYLRRIFCLQFLRINPQLDTVGVTADGETGSRLATRHLLDLGHRRIGFIGVSSTYPIGAFRLAGHNAELRRHRIASDPLLIRLGDGTEIAGEHAIAELLALDTPPTAIFLSNPAMALGAARTLNARGITDPRKLSLVALGASSWFDVWPGGMTSVEVPVTEMSLLAAEMLLAGNDKDARKSSRVVSVAHRLIIRGSTCRNERV